MTFYFLFTFMFMALIIVLIIRGDLVFIFPAIFNYINKIIYNLGNMVNTFYGKRQSIDPDPSNQFIGLSRNAPHVM